ncbi:ZDH24 palmitoyltransferase, partial [Polypterus senegalus]
MTSFRGRLWSRLEAICRFMPVIVNTVLVVSITGEVMYLVMVEAPLEPEQKERDWAPLWKGVHLASQIFMFGNILWNASLFLRTSPSIRGVFLEGSAVGQGWSCLLFMWAGLLYAVVLNVEVFIIILKEGITPHSVLLLLMPWIMLITGQVTARAFAFAFVADTCVVGCLCVSAFLFFHVALMLRGQTTREWYSNQRPYSLGWRRNILECLGERWYVAWLCPLIPSPFPGDGIHFLVTAPPSGVRSDNVNSGKN